MVRGPGFQQCEDMVAPAHSAQPVQKIPSRSDLRAEDTWDLSPLFADEAAWEKGLESLRAKRGAMTRWRGKLAGADGLVGALEEERGIDLLAEKLGQYASLRVAEDGSDGAARDR
ncbi:MAG: hypothetical protein EBT57_08835, partial [Verrucomicrobia bacterium]|nr:hypothetical protein [Verrucomicrobiota bacterium]